ncbi:MAG: carboxylating nicotinate-nucleotide diphosphorylase [Chitinophagaceae bacterium]|nr:carboxylating nicotinate-nucleotide diphosphorylase [Bacteroidota bacterium]MCC6258411.1 carboxylating nicotinate-nucleotide diphosphorylase [Chitinophagaceae bacterium]MCW5917261.1 carboxylating nicotinate-nucleotide diphosphorylase [Ferruginibacter sp.]
MEYDNLLNILIKNALQEDIGPGDYSTRSSIGKEARGKAVLKIKQQGILAGVNVAERIFKYMQPEIRFVSFKRDGDPMEPGQLAFEVYADVHTILMCERLVLNCMQRMSGIATLTQQYVKQMQGCHAKLLDTRKTTPNFRLLEKEAVRIGGGFNHRFGLYDMIMLKDNHIDYCGGITPAIQKANAFLKENQLSLPIEVETRSLDDVREVLRVGKVSRIMLDNFNPAEIAKAVLLIAGRYETEASGGITLDNIREYAQTGVDFISSGAIIHQAKSLDLSLKAVIEK